MVWFSDLCPKLCSLSGHLIPGRFMIGVYVRLHVILYPVTFISSWNHVLLILLQIRKWIAPRVYDIIEFLMDVTWKLNAFKPF